MGMLCSFAGTWSPFYFFYTREKLRIKIINFMVLGTYMSESNFTAILSIAVKTFHSVMYINVMLVLEEKFEIC